MPGFMEPKRRRKTKIFRLRFFQRATGEANPSVRVKSFPDHGHATDFPIEREGPVAFWWDAMVERQRQGHGIFYFVNVAKNGMGSSTGKDGKPNGYTCSRDIIGAREYCRRSRWRHSR